MRDSEKIATLEGENARLMELVRASVAAFKAMSPVDQAIMHVQQRASFVKGNISLDVDWTEAHQSALDADPAVVLVNEVVRLRKELTELRQMYEGLCK